MEKAIYEGYIGESAFSVQALNKQHLSQIDYLQQVVYDALPDKRILQTLTEEELLYILNGKGLMIGAYVEGELIAFRALLIPGLDDEHLGYDIGLKADSDLERVIYQEISIVHPNYRGYGLQKILANVIMEQVDTKKFHYVCATVMPYNIASLKDKFAQGMTIRALKYKYGGKLRYVFVLPLHSRDEYEEDSIYKLMDNIEEQQKLLENSYYGISMKKVDEDWVVEYKKVRT